MNNVIVYEVNASGGVLRVELDTARLQGRSVYRVAALELPQPVEVPALDGGIRVIRSVAQQQGWYPLSASPGVAIQRWLEATGQGRMVAARRV